MEFSSCMRSASHRSFRANPGVGLYAGENFRFQAPPTQWTSTEKLASADAAPMLCAGLTTYSALRKCKARSGEWVVISGRAYRVIGIDHGSKEVFVKDCGAEVFIDMPNFSDEDIAKEVKRVTGGLKRLVQTGRWTLRLARHKPCITRAKPANNRGTRD
ncbi:hypothetical protein VC83_03012 [Pseudogymnoascus destructans]|uniref:Uncharacterized protein n=1 Tax=Pseudogymnoascus destructans TaxID=655981 RepID=A0A177ADV9_9PEZI|nr:uncharacterized protein VC83_03012 [Pseudogymnoascus destructans]OAF60257.1 hypothetical protein VC83_03012 [Pseudogymnoascus destructans]